MYDNLDMIAIGESVIEFSTDKSFALADTFTKHYGGYALGAAIAALRSGLKVGYITKVKNDSFGEFLLDCWQTEGLDAGHVKFAEYQNGVYFTGICNGKTELEFYRKKTAASTMSISDIDFEYIKSAKFVFATGLIQSLSLNCRDTIREVFKFAKKNGVMVGYYPDFRHTELLRDEALEMFYEVKEYVDLIFVNTKNNFLFETDSPDKIITELIDNQLENALVIKKGEGLWAVDRTEVNFIKTPEFDMVDVTGYTSAIIGGYIASRLKGEAVFESLKYANILGMLQASKIGAIKSIPTREEVLEAMKRLYGEN